VKSNALFLALILLCGASFGQNLPLMGVGVGGALSNIRLIQSVAASNTTTGADYSVTVAATGAGNGLIILQNDADNPAAPSVPTGVTGSTCVTDHTEASAANGRDTIFSCPNISSGITSVSIHRVSGHSSANVREYSGMKTSSMLDSVVSTQNNFTSGGNPLNSPTLASTQTDLGIGWCSQGSSTNVHGALVGEWGNLKDYPQPNDTTDSFAGDILNGLQSQFTYEATGDSHTYVCGVATYKSAVPGATPLGNLQGWYCDFENSTNGTTVTLAIFNAGCHGGNQTNVTIGTGFTIATAAQQTQLSPAVVNGTSYAGASGTRGISYDLSTNPVQKMTFHLQASQASISLLGFFTISDNSVLYDIVDVSAAGADLIVAQVQTGTPGIILECTAGNSAALSISLNTSYAIGLDFREGAGGTGTHKLSIWTGAPSYSTLVGTKTCASTGSNLATIVEFGQGHSAVGTGHLYVDNLQISNGSTSLAP
jgi:hypothetical protein